MKTIVYKVTVLFVALSLLLCLSACGKEYEAGSFLNSFCKAYGARGQLFYSTDADEGEELQRTIYCRLPRVAEWALLTGGAEDYEEFGVFVTRGDYEKLELCDILKERLEFLEKTLHHGGKIIVIHGSLVVYGYALDPERAQNTLEDML